MNRRITLAAGLVLAAAVCTAREPMVPPSPSGVASAASLFIGHHGQILGFPKGWAVEAEMRGETEIVYFHRAFVNGDPAMPLQPKPSDYKPGNFTAMGLMELVVIPKDAPGGLKSLEALRAAKERSLLANGFTFRIFDADETWPSGTFHVETYQPQRFSQTYSQSAKHFHIFTAGGGLDDRAGTSLRRSLAASLSSGAERPARTPLLPLALLGGAVLAAVYLLHKMVTR